MSANSPSQSEAAEIERLVRDYWEAYIHFGDTSPYAAGPVEVHDRWRRRSQYPWVIEDQRLEVRRLGITSVSGDEAAVEFEA